jgi:PAS domain S-box-containing protein
MSQTILLIEDNEQNRYLITFLLEKHGYTIVTAADGPRGIELAQATPPAIVLLDIQLPTMDGYAVARALRSQAALRNVPIVAVTSHAMRGDREKILAAGCNGYIEKPINPDTFVAELLGFLPARTVMTKTPTRVLVVDDKEENLSYLEALLKGHGCTVESARHGAEALIMARHNPPDLVISDLLMPVMDGFTLLRHWRIDAKLRKIPFIVYTATYTTPADEQLARSLGADDFILKPCEPEKFLVRLREVQARAAAGKLTVPRQPSGDEKALLKVYSEALIRKLEEKSLLLEESNRTLHADVAERRKLAETQASILDALPAHLALIDSQGVILAVNESWRQFATANSLQSPAFGVGQNYFTVCDQATGDCSEEAKAAANGIRQVLAGELPQFNLEYPCHTPLKQHWFRLMVTPLRPGQGGGAVILHLDVTSRKLALEALELSEAQQRQITRHSEKQRTELADAQAVAHIGSWETDLSTGEVTWSDQTHRIFETNPATFSPTHLKFLELVHPDDRAAVDTAFQQSHKQRLGCILEHRLQLPSGHIKAVEERWQTFFDEQGQATRAIGTCQDITERKRVEEQLKHSRALAIMAGRLARIGAWAVDQPNSKVFWSDEVAAIHEVPPGYAPDLDEAIKFYAPEYRTQITEKFIACANEGTPFDMELEIITAKGRLVWVRSIGEALRDAEGRIIRVQGAFQDISERKQTESRIVEQAALIDESRDAIVVRNLDHQIVFWSKGAERIFGWMAAEAVGRPFSQVVKLDAAVLWEADKTVREKGEWNGETQKMAKDGSVHTLSSRWLLLRDGAGQPKSILSTDTDITERKKLEQQFLRAQRMESVGTLAGGIAHDLNNLLSPIVMGVSLLRQYHTSPNALSVITNIERSAQRGTSLVKQVLSFARGVEGSRVSVHLKHIAEEVESIAHNTFPKNITTEVDVPETVWVVTGDPTQLNQVLLNLCVNARDAMPDGGRITVSAHNTEIDVQYAVMNRGVTPGRYVVLEVSDNGSGIPKEIVDRIFEPFFTTKEIGKGTGLGLSTVLGIVRSHGGFVNVYSEPNKGSEFKVYLPAQAEGSVETDSATKKEEMPRGHGELIMLVDDESTILSVTQQTLEAFGYKVITAEDGAHAIGLFALHRKDIAVVLTDIMMPVMDGPALIVALRRIDPRIRIIAASGLKANDHIAKIVPTGVKHFLAKPYSAQAMLITLRTILSEPVGSRSPIDPG